MASIDMAHPAITVLIPTFNRAEYLAECLDSILAQTLAPAQVVVVNDGSTDATRSVLTPYSDQIDYVETDQLGKPGALNAGLKHVTGDYVWIFDDDDVALPDALERLVAPLEKHPEHGFSFAPFHFTDSRPSDHRIGEVMHTLPIPDLDTRGFLIPLLEGNFLGGAALFARTRCYDEVGNFDPRLLRSQDYEMAIRIARAFTGIRVPGGATFHYRQHESLRGSTADRFTASQQRAKWLEYDQIIFRELYDSLPLHAYLPPGVPLHEQRRQALIQRMGIMASKLLWDRVRMDLRAIAALDDESPINRIERNVVQGLVRTDPYYNIGGLYHQDSFFAEISQLATTSKAVQRLRAELVRALFARLKATRLRHFPRWMSGTFQRMKHMYRGPDKVGLTAGVMRDMSRNLKQ
jgi:glycosyltransferase involved in cell wall biosynthesis